MRTKATTSFFILLFTLLTGIIGVLSRPATAEADALADHFTYLPIILKPPSPQTAFSQLSTGANHTEARAGETVDRTNVATTYLQTTNTAGYYLMGRTHIEFNVGSYSNPVITADCRSQTSRPSDPPQQIDVRRGSWGGTITSLNETELWQSGYGSRLALASASDCIAGRISITLPTSGSGALKIVVIDKDDYRDMRPSWATGDYRTFTLSNIGINP